MRDAAAYERLKEHAARRTREISAAGRDIGPIPAPIDPDRRAAAVASFRVFCETYFAAWFPWAWSDDHLEAIATIQTTAIDGGQHAFAMPRGNGKTTLCQAGALWAIVCGHRRFILPIGASKPLAQALLDNIKLTLAMNALLAEDFPEVCYPIARLENISRRAAGQTCQGKPTMITWGAEEIRLPVIPGSKASGAVIQVAGIDGGIRGRQVALPTGEIIRPDFVILDDPQTDESARSPSQCAERERVIKGAILGLSGPAQTISLVMPCTVIRPGDMVDRILNPELNPAFNGRRSKMVIEWPKRDDLWERYADLRRAGQRKRPPDVSEANAFYAENRAAMDDGAIVAWPERKRAGEATALQHAWNLRIDRGDQAFWAEYQNEPLPEHETDLDLLTDDVVAQRVNGFARGVVPFTAAYLTAFVDVQEHALFWAVSAWEQDFTGYLVDYGIYPKQHMQYTPYRSLKRTLAMEFPRATLEGRIFAGLGRLVGEIADRNFPREGGGEVRVGRILIDKGWQTDVIENYCRQSPHAAIVMPAKGYSVGATSRPFDEWTRAKGDRFGDHWIVPTPKRAKITRHVLIDTNHWKGFVNRRLLASPGDSGSLTLFKADRDVHRLISEHLTSERPIKVTAKGRTVDEWKLKRPNIDNHWFDCVVGSAVAASLLGAALPSSSGSAVTTKRKYFKMSDRIRARREAKS